MSEENKVPVSFQDVILSDATAFSDSLLAAHPELKSVSIVFEWNMPDNVQGDLQSGFLRTPDKKISLNRAFDALKSVTRYCKQLSDMIDYIADTERKFIQNNALNKGNSNS